MLLTHTKLVLGNNITYMSAYNYFSAVPMVLLMELKIINDADKYLDKYLEMVRENDEDGILYTDSIFNNPKSMIVFGEYLWLMFIREYRKMNDYQKSYCFWRYLEYTKDNIANALTHSFKEIEMDEDYDMDIDNSGLVDLSKIYGSESRKLREKYLKRYLKYPKSKGDTYPRLEGNSIQRFKELYDFHFEYFKKGLYYSKEETHFYLTVPYSVLCEPILDNFRGIYENNSNTLWQVEGNNFIQSKITMDTDHEKLMLRREYAIIFGKGGRPKTIDQENVSIVYFNPDEAHIIKALKQQMASRQYFRINGNYYTADGRSYIQQGVDTNLTNNSSITTRYTYNDYYSLYSTNSSATFGYDSTVSTINSSYDDYADLIRHVEDSRSVMRNFATRSVGKKVPSKKKKKTRKIDSKFIKSYTFLTKVLSLDHIKQMRKNGIIIEGQYFNYKFKVKDRELISKSKHLDNFSIAYDLNVLAKDTGEELTSLCIVYPGMPICDEISTNILFIRSGEEDTLLAKANHLSRSENYCLYFENKKRITPERRFEIEFERLLKEESRTKLKSSEDNSIVSFFSNMENNIVQNESVRERFENERFKKSQTISFINKFLQREFGFEDVNYNQHNLKYYYLYKAFIKHFKPDTKVNVSRVFKFKENVLFKEIIQKNRRALKLSFKRSIKTKLKFIKNNKTKISLKGQSKWRRLRNLKNIKDLEISSILDQRGQRTEDYVITNYQRQNVCS